ncbi:MAG: hypothetical protein WCL14_00750 [Bacteroidota bacterium]
MIAANAINCLRVILVNVAGRTKVLPAFFVEKVDALMIAPKEGNYQEIIKRYLKQKID